MRIGHNMFSEGIFKTYKRNLAENSKALENISSGKKLNSAKDNPNKIEQSENLKIQLLSRNAASQNIQDTNSMLQTFDGAMQEMNNNVARLKELVVKAASGTCIEEDRELINTEVQKIKESMDYLANNTTFNNIKLSDITSNNSAPNTKLANIGAGIDENLEIPFYNLTNNGTGINVIDVMDPALLSVNIDAVDNAGKLISSVRSKYGAIQSRLEDTLDDISGMNQSLSEAQSGLEDADIAKESLEYSRTQILYQSSIALMVQSNKLPQDSLNVLASVR